MNDISTNSSYEEEYTPKLFQKKKSRGKYFRRIKRRKIKFEELFDQDISEDEDFEIPAFLRRQKF